MCLPLLVRLTGLPNVGPVHIARGVPDRAAAWEVGANAWAAWLCVKCETVPGFLATSYLAGAKIIGF